MERRIRLRKQGHSDTRLTETGREADLRGIQIVPCLHGLEKTLPRAFLKDRSLICSVSEHTHVEGQHEAAIFHPCPQPQRLLGALTHYLSSRHGHQFGPSQGTYLTEIS